MDKNKLRREFLIKRIQEECSEEFQEEAIAMVEKHFGKEGLVIPFRPLKETL